MDTYIVWLVSCSIAFWIGNFVGKHTATLNMLRALARDPESFMRMAEQVKKIDEADSQDELETVSTQTGTEMLIERVGDQLFAYAKDTKQFLGQAKDLNSLLKTVNERFPGQGFFGTISKDNPAKELVK
jgi:hypothetical protein